MKLYKGQRWRLSLFPWALLLTMVLGMAAMLVTLQLVEGSPMLAVLIVAVVITTPICLWMMYLVPPEEKYREFQYRRQLVRDRNWFIWVLEDPENRVTEDSAKRLSDLLRKPEFQVYAVRAALWGKDQVR